MEAHEIPALFQENIFSVSDINGMIKELFDRVPVFSSVKIRGEISNFKNHVKSGHLYFTLKDTDSSIKAVMFRGSAVSLRFKPEDGMRVIAEGRLSTYPKDGVYQLYINAMQPDGTGALYEAFERLKKRLEAEGLFAPERKKPLPPYPRTIGIITSSTGAAVRDIINVAGRRYPLAKLVIFPALVQGEGAERSLISGLQYFNSTKSADIIILGRGGGSIEDLWAFNGEELARTVAASEIPVISAVGHETDFTVCDFVADKRAPTPSAAAELAVPDATALLGTLRAYRNDMERAVCSELRFLQTKLSELSSKRVLSSPDSFLDFRREDVMRLEERLCLNWQRLTERESNRLAALAGKLNVLSPLSVIARGFGAAFDSEGKLVSSTEQLPPEADFTLQLSDGTVKAVSKGRC